jgi:H+/gluconate symporter-like permease
MEKWLIALLIGTGAAVVTGVIIALIFWPEDDDEQEAATQEANNAETNTDSKKKKNTLTNVSVLSIPFLIILSFDFKRLIDLQFVYTVGPRQLVVRSRAPEA